jgi:phage-related protein
LYYNLDKTILKCYNLNISLGRIWKKEDNIMRLLREVIESLLDVIETVVNGFVNIVTTVVNKVVKIVRTIIE